MICKPSLAARFWDIIPGPGAWPRTGADVAALRFALIVARAEPVSEEDAQRLVTAVLSVYSSEIYPTRIRSHGTGLAAGASKAGGVIIIGLVVLGVATPSIAGTTLIGAIPMAVAALGILFFGVETRNRRLEEITAEEFRLAAGPVR